VKIASSHGVSVILCDWLRCIKILDEEFARHRRISYDGQYVFCHETVWCVEFAITAVVYFPPLDFTS
jgi:hypothetical protein